MADEDRPLGHWTKGLSEPWNLHWELEKTTDQDECLVSAECPDSLSGRTRKCTPMSGHQWKVTVSVPLCIFGCGHSLERWSEDLRECMEASP